MFRNANSFNQDISDWTVNNVTDMTQMFYSAAAFNQDLRWWDVSNVLSYGNFAAGNVNASWTNLPFFGQTFNYYPLTNTATDPTSSIWRSDSTPAGGYRFKPNDGIYTLPGEPITSMYDMFAGNTNFNDPDITTWDTSSVTNFNGVFVFASTFNQPIGAWDTSNCTSMTGMFAFASTFNQPIGNWDVSNVTNMVQLFYQASSFNQDLRWWDVSNIAAEPLYFGGAAGWTTKPLWGVTQYGPTFNYYPLTNTATDPTNTTWQNSYTPAGGYRFKPNDGIYTLPGEPITNMSYMFYNNTTFNDPDITSWDVSSVTDMSSMFQNASAFNQDLTGWDVSNVTNYLNFSLDANSSWTLKPIKEITIDSSFSVTFTGIVSTQSYINRYVDIVLFHPSDLGAGGAALTYDPAMALLADVVISLELTSTSFTEPSDNNMSQNVLLENPFNANYTTYYSLQNNQQMSEAITYTGDLLPYTNFSNTNNATTGGDYIIRIRCGTNSYTTFLVGQPPTQTILYDHRTIEFTGNYSLTFSFSF
jgi:surface protein